MCNQNEWIVREAFLAYDRGDVARMMDFVDPDLEWTHLDPSHENPQSLVCDGRSELESALKRQADLGLHAELEEVAGDRTFDVATVRDGLIVGLRACRDRSEARTVAGIA